MAMGRGMRMYLMANGENRETENRRPEKVYNIDGTYNVNVEGGGNRSERGNVDTRTNARRQGDPRSEWEPEEMRYRGKDGRYKAGRRRAEYTDTYGGEYGGEMGDRETYEVTIEPEDNIIPYMPRRSEEERRSGYEREDGQRRQIGFGATMGMEHQKEGEMHKGMAHSTGMSFDRETAEEWVRNMHNEDRAHPVGGKWSVEQIKPLAMKHNMPTEGKRWWEFYAMVNAMYSDYSEVAKRFNITSPDFYALMAKAFMDDQDAEDDKVALYWEYIAKK